MVALPGKRLVLVAIFLLCFISITAKARSVPKESGNGADQKGTDGNETLTFTAKAEARELPAESNSDQDLVIMDYTPAQKRPPIHN